MTATSLKSLVICDPGVGSTLLALDRQIWC
jgi:hypothetical protein